MPEGAEQRVLLRPIRWPAKKGVCSRAGKSLILWLLHTSWELWCAASDSHRRSGCVETMVSLRHRAQSTKGMG
jgi:hypothetical protein